MHWPQDSRDEARGERSIRGAVKPTERERTRKYRASRKARTRGRAREKEREAGISRRLDEGREFEGARQSGEQRERTKAAPRGGTRWGLSGRKPSAVNI